MFRSSAGETVLDLQTPVQLNHRDRELSFTIRALSFIEPNQHRYQYQLVGFDDDWVEVDASGVRTFSQLPSGQFTLRARAMVAGADWVEASQQVQIDVAPPPWKTVPAYLAYAVMLLTLLWMILRQLKRRLQERHQTALIAQEKEFAVRANQAKRDFLADVGHEIRTPMSGLLGMTDLLLDSNLNANQRENAEIVRRSGHHLLRLVNDLLDLSKIEAGKASLHEETVNLPDLIQEVVHIERPLIQSKSLQLVTEIDPKLPTWIHVDGQRLRQILFNLLGNAVKFTSAVKSPCVSPESMKTNGVCKCKTQALA